MASNCLSSTPLTSYSPASSPPNGPGINRTDFTIERTFALGERLRLDVRSDWDNIFNHPNFGNPDGKVGNVGSLNSDFGFVHGAQTSRMGQLVAKLYF